MNIYRIRVVGHLDQRWADWFGDFSMEYSDQHTLLTCSIPDQAALHGVLAKIRDLGLTIVLVENVHHGAEDDDEEL